MPIPLLDLNVETLIFKLQPRGRELMSNFFNVIAQQIKTIKEEQREVFVYCTDAVSLAAIMHDGEDSNLRIRITINRRGLQIPERDEQNDVRITAKQDTATSTYKTIARLVAPGGPTARGIEYSINDEPFEMVKFKASATSDKTPISLLVSMINVYPEWNSACNELMTILETKGADLGL